VTSEINSAASGLTAIIEAGLSGSIRLEERQLNTLNAESCSDGGDSVAAGWTASGDSRLYGRGALHGYCRPVRPVLIVCGDLGGIR